MMNDICQRHTSYRAYWGDDMDAKLERFVNQAENTLNENFIPILVVSDYNTKGLSGSHNEKKSSPWEALTGSDGISVKYDRSSGGSYGIGKNAPFACSSLSMVFYNTFAEDNKSAFIGVARLATLLDNNGEPTQRVGRYQVNDNENKEWKPIYPEDKNNFRDIFKRTEYGTDVIIVGFSSDEWLKNVTNAVLKNFFVAICENKLVVELKDGNETISIDDKSIEKLFTESVKESPEIIASYQLYKAFTESEKEQLAILENNDLEVYIKADANYKRTIGNFRSTGMLINIYSRRIFQHYAAVVIARGEKLGELLKDTEPPLHDRWDYKQIDSSEKQRRKSAKEAINKISSDVLDLLKKQFETVNETTIDAAGVSDYLAYNEDTDGTDSDVKGDDELRVKVKIGKMTINRTSHGTTTKRGKKGKGTPQKGTVHNQTTNPDINEPSRFLIPVAPDGLAVKEGVIPGKGSKTLITPNITAQRAFPINASLGIYKIVINPKKDYNNMFIECSAVGEDGRSDSLEMETFTYQNRKINIVDGKAGPVKVSADNPASFFVTFRRKEKMKLNLILTEVVEK
ncbi:MAG: hypothetical protein K6G55_00150 [Selenomonadaceae bacterium]|nr:hypothetical protein [Selenomonadaceae bacterium]